MRPFGVGSGFPDVAALEPAQGSGHGRGGPVRPRAVLRGPPQKIRYFSRFYSFLPCSVQIPAKLYTD